MPIKFEEIEVISDNGKVKVVLEWIGEGNSGDYHEDDPEDSPLLRFTVYRHYQVGEPIDEFFVDNWEPVTPDDIYKGWRPVADGSYCTALDARAPREELTAVAQIILRQVESEVTAEQRCKGLMEEMSWWETSDKK